MNGAIATPRAGLAAALAALIALSSPHMHAQTIVETALPGSGRPLSVALPAPAPTAGAPIVVSLHYGGPAPAYYGRGLLESVVAPALAPLGAVMVAPDCAADAWIDPGCTGDVLAAIDFAASSYGADPTRVVLTGYSKGGIGAWALSDAHPQRFAAVVAMAARASVPAFDAAPTVPAYVIHGEADELFPIADVRQAVDDRLRAGQQVSLQVLDATTHYQTQAFVAPLAAALSWLEQQLAR